MSRVVCLREGEQKQLWPSSVLADLVPAVTSKIAPRVENTAAGLALPCFESDREAVAVKCPAHRACL